MELQGEFLNGDREKMLGVIKKVSEATGVPVDDITGPRRHKHILRARNFAILTCRDYVGASLPAIGRVFNRDHTTVINAIRRMDEVMTLDDIEDLETVAKAAGLVDEPGANQGPRNMAEGVSY